MGAGAARCHPRALALLLIASPQTRSSRYVADELRIAELYGRRVYPLWVEGEQWMECVPLGWGGLQYLDARGEQYEGGARHARGGVRAPARELAPASHPCRAARVPEGAAQPLQGPARLHRADAGDFFGRERLVECADRGAGGQSERAPRFLALVGASGSGKSSVLLAGLLPRLQAGALAGSERWIYLPPLVPGSRRWRR